MIGCDLQSKIDFLQLMLNAHNERSDDKNARDESNLHLSEDGSSWDKKDNVEDPSQPIIQTISYS